jgi:hypothetical protein
MKSKSLIFCICFFIAIIFVYAEKDDGGTFGAVYKNIGTASLYSTGKAIAEYNSEYIFYNPAGLVLDTQYFISSSYSKLFDEVDGIKQIEMTIGIPYKQYYFGILYSNFAVDDIREADENGLTGNLFNSDFQKFSISGAKEVIENIFLGVSLNYYNQSIASFDLKNYTASLSGLYQKNKLQLSLKFDNLYSTTAKGNRKKEKLPIITELGAQYRIMEDMIMGASLLKEEYRSFDYHFGARYELFDKFWVNVGYLSETQQITGGFSLFWKKLNFQYVYINHEDLSSSQKISVTFCF